MQSLLTQNGEFTKSIGKIKLITELNKIQIAFSLKLAIYSIIYVHQIVLTIDIAILIAWNYINIEKKTLNTPAIIRISNILVHI